MEAMRRETSLPGDTHVVLFTALCVVSAARGGLLAFFVDVILVGAYGTGRAISQRRSSS